MSDAEYNEAEYKEEVKNLAAKLEKENLLPDGIGMPLEQVRALLAHTHETVLDKADPILMVVTMLNAHLREVEKLQEKHQEGLGKFMADKTDAYVSGVKEGVAQLTDSLSSASVEGIRKVFDDHAARLQAFKNSTAWLAAIVGVSALLNVAVFALGGLR